MGLSAALSFFSSTQSQKDWCYRFICPDCKRGRENGYRERRIAECRIAVSLSATNSALDTGMHLCCSLKVEEQVPRSLLHTQPLYNVERVLEWSNKQMQTSSWYERWQCGVANLLIFWIVIWHIFLFSNNKQLKPLLLIKSLQEKNAKDIICCNEIQHISMPILMEPFLLLFFLYWEKVSTSTHS